MKRFKILRVSTSEIGTFGVLMDGGNIPFAVTAEPPWLANTPKISCIFAGDYICSRYNSPTHGIVYQFNNIYGRDAIQLHKGNYPLKDTEGCILIAESFDVLNGTISISNSLGGFNEFMSMCDGDMEIFISIKEVY